MFATLITSYILLLQTAATPTPAASSTAGEYTSFLWFAMGMVVGVVIGVLVAVVIVKTRHGSEKGYASLIAPEPPQSIIRAPRQQPAAVEPPLRCPVCNSTYTDQTLKYCLSDGASLVRVGHQDPSATMVYPEKGRKDLPPTIPSGPR